MVKAKFVVDNREAGETEDCGLIVAIGLGEMKEENQFQLAVVGGKGLRGSMMVQGLADGIAEAISRMTDNDMQAIAMLTAFIEETERRCKKKILERLTTGNSKAVEQPGRVAAGEKEPYRRFGCGCLCGAKSL